MKRKMIIAACILVATGFMAFAQGAPAASPAGNGLDSSGSIRMTSDLYPVRVDVTKIYSHSQGLKVVYRKGGSSFAELFIPSSWFVPGGKAALMRGYGPEYPYLVVYYSSDGSFSHLKLYAMRNLKDATWGVIDGDPGDRFKVETVKLEF